ncbi:hypothetical protein BCV70DRAFT_188355 [Testicularia cyperi]|uniref:SET domain-containing protein n=1 Tax=Testicularia cyperi TaxID=1882483 RepID=A0A317XSE6_9BASI|nr:hypothetical protein BCV70DRAFT_188355 [Testicularia cyperi]
MQKAGTSEWWTNKSVAPDHRPTPSSTSKLNAEPLVTPQARQLPRNWPSDVVFITQNLTSDSIPDSVATDYILGPYEQSHQTDPQSTDTRPSSKRAKHLPTATHNSSRPSTVYLEGLELEIPLHIHRIDSETTWNRGSYHARVKGLTVHPSLGSCGLFAAQPIPSNTFVRPYLGVLHRKCDADRYSHYDLHLGNDRRISLASPSASEPRSKESPETSSNTKSESDPDGERNIYIDSRFWGNESRFTNDYRGIAERPNVEFRSFVQKTGGGDLKFGMGIWTIKPIRRGEELVVNYGKSFWRHHDEVENENESESESDNVNVNENTDDLPGKQQSVELGDYSQTVEGNSPALDPIQARLARARDRIQRGAARPPFIPPSRRSQPPPNAPSS